MRTVGQILKDERLKKGFTLEQIEKSTRIRAKFLAAIEADDYKKMPVVPYIQGFIKNYSTFLGLKSTTMLALFRRQFIQKEREKKILDAPLTESGWRITPNKVILTLILILIGVLFFYFYTQYKALHTPPPLVVEGPVQELVTKDDSVAVFGKTDKDAALTINGDPVLIKDDGRFYKEFPITVGNNTVSIEATSRAGEKTKVTLTMTRLPN